MAKTKSLSTNQFSESQVAQMMIAEQNFGIFNTEIKKHPEWSSTLMNLCINTEKEEKPLDAIYKTADALHKLQLPSDEGTGTIGNDLSIVVKIRNIFEKGGSLPIPAYGDGWKVTDELYYHFQLLCTYLELCGCPKLISGRFCFDDKYLFLGDDNLLFSEGLEEALSIISQLSGMGVHYGHKNTVDVHRDPWAAIGQNAFNMMSVKLSFDDMNIRGYQLIDALEFVDGSAQKLYELIHQPYPMNTRSEELVKYVNACSAKRVKELDKTVPVKYIAVNGGASFDKKEPGIFSMSRNQKEAACRYTMNVVNYADYESPISKLELDYSTVDITQDTNLKSAIRAAEARGFKLLKKTKPRRNSWRDETCAVLMYNPDTGAFIKADSAKEDNICYGGCYLDMWIPVKAKYTWDMTAHASSGCPIGYNEIRWFQYTYHEGLFAGYDKLKDYVDLSVIDWERLGWGMDAMPYAKLWTHDYFMERELSPKIGFTMAHFLSDMGSYYLDNLINMICTHFDTEVDETACPQWNLCHDDDFLVKMFGSAGCHNENDVPQTFKLLRLACLILRMPDDVCVKMADSFRDYVIMCDAKALADFQERKTQALEQGWKIRREEIVKGDEYIKAFKKHKHLLEGFKDDVLTADTMIKMNGDIQKQGVKLPWL